MHIPPSFIKKIALQIKSDYKFDNAPFAVNENRERGGAVGKSVPFIGRKQHQAKFLEFLHGNSKKGVFLVTGFRGMGKTSFVNHVIQTYKNSQKDNFKWSEIRKRKIIPIHLTLAQNKPKEIDILRLIVSSVYDSYLDYSKKHSYLTKKVFYKLVKLLFIPLLLVECILLSRRLDVFHQFAAAGTWFGNDQIKSFLVSIASKYIFLLLFINTVAFLVFKFLLVIDSKRRNAYNRISNLFDSCYSSSSE